MKSWPTLIKLILLFSVTSLMILLHTVLVTLCICIGMILISLIMLPKSSLKSRLAPIGMVALLVVAFQVMFNTNTPLLARSLFGIMIAARLIGLSLAVFLFTENTSVSEIVAALAFLPSRFRLLITISFALLPTIIRETKNIFLVQQTRGFRSNKLNVFKNFIPIMVPLLHRTLTRAEQLAIALETKGTEV